MEAIKFHKIRFHRRRAAVPANKFFTIDTSVEHECSLSASQIIRVQSARLGYSEMYYLHSKPPQCPWLNCTKPTGVPATEYDGRKKCNIRQEILNSPGCYIQTAISAFFTLIYFIMNIYGHSGPHLRCYREKNALLKQLSNCA